MKTEKENLNNGIPEYMDTEPGKVIHLQNEDKESKDIGDLIKEKILLLKGFENENEVPDYKLGLIKDSGGSEEELKTRTKIILEKINKLISRAVLSLELLAVSFIPSDTFEQKNVNDNQTSIYINKDISPVKIEAKVARDFFNGKNDLGEVNSSDTVKISSEDKTGDDYQDEDNIEPEDNMFSANDQIVKKVELVEGIDIAENEPVVSETDNFTENIENETITKNELNNIWEMKKWNEKEPYMNWYYKLPKNEREAFKKNNYLKNNDWDNISDSFNSFTKIKIKAVELFSGKNNFELIKQKLLDITEKFFKFYNERERSGEMTKEETDFKKELMKELKNKSDDPAVEELKGKIEYLSAIKLSELSPGQKDVYFNLIEKYLGINSSDIYLKESFSCPTKGKKEGSKFFDFSDEIKKEMQNLSNEDFENIFKKPNKLYDYVNKNTDIKIFSLLKKKNIEFGSSTDGKDRKGERYISYYYNYDLSPNGLKEKTIDFSKVNFPFMIYGRIYEKDLNITK